MLIRADLKRHRTNIRHIDIHISLNAGIQNKVHFKTANIRYFYFIAVHCHRSLRRKGRIRIQRYILSVLSCHSSRGKSKICRKRRIAAADFNFRARTKLIGYNSQRLAIIKRIGRHFKASHSRFVRIGKILRRIIYDKNIYVRLFAARS